MPQFISKYSTKDLVEFKSTEPTAENLFGFIEGVSFHKMDAVNHAATYKIHMVNSEEVIDGIAEHDIVKRYSADERPR